VPLLAGIYKDEEPMDQILVVHYNYVRKHQTLKMTPAQASGLNVKNNWYNLVKDATKNMAKKDEKQVQQIELTIK
jgi:hypothetical protein